MPGILPMKVIKVGPSSQSRIAQACDRCRSKKIRCDGIRPCCSQCSSVGFECKTSDKLSRRAFPRGYTESLEERVRALEAEVRELKDLLDEKDEKIDMLSKMHSNRRPSHASPTVSPPSNAHEEISAQKDDTFRVQSPPSLVGDSSSDSYFMGDSSGRAFVEAFKRKVQETGKSCPSLNTDAFCGGHAKSTVTVSSQPSTPMRSPPRLFSDRCINVFWQEWSPLFPIINKSSFLRLYEEYIANPENMTDHYKLAQLHLVFGIAGLSSDLPDLQQISLCESQWRTSIDAIAAENSLETLQCLVLVMLYCILNGNFQRLQHYRGIAVALSHRLGLQQNQKRFSFDVLTIETRKKVFWTLYTVDCFAAALLGLPRLIKEDDIDVDYPIDLDDEYVTEKGYLPTLPGESSKISNALALFRVSRILSKVLDLNYPAAASRELSLQSIAALEAELNDWSDNLPPHLKLTFVQDKPSTDITGSRSALLSLAYYYIRTLIHRPAVGSSLGTKASSSVISLADSSKHIIQIVQLLEERCMSFSFCVNKNDLLALCGLSLLYQGLDLKQEGKLMKDGLRLVGCVAKYLQKGNSPAAAEFKGLILSLATIQTPPAGRRVSDQATANSKLSKSSIAYRHGSAQSSLQHSPATSNSEIDGSSLQSSPQSTASVSQIYSMGRQSNHSHSSLDSNSSEPAIPRREYHISAPHLPTPEANLRNSAHSSQSRPNLDYLSLSNTPSASQLQSPYVSRSGNVAPSDRMPHVPNFPTSIQKHLQKSSTTSPAEWESLLSSLDGGITNIYDAVYGGPPLDLTSPTLRTIPTQSSPTKSGYADTYPEWDLSPEAWDMTALSMVDFNSSDLTLNLNPHTAQSVLSFSEESLSSSDDIGDFVAVDPRTFGEYRVSIGSTAGDGFGVEGLEGFGIGRVL